MTDIPNPPELMFGVRILAAEVVVGCEEVAYEMREHPEAVRMLGTREVTIMEQKF